MESVLYGCNNADRLSAIKMFALNGANETVYLKTEQLFQLSHQFNQMFNGLLLIFAFC